jgi:hypothetical protein
MADCIEWNGALSSSGYGNVTVNRKTWKAHRLAWTRANGDIPEGLCVLHKCDNRKCINVEHLFLGTKQDNCDDMMRKGRGRKAYGERHALAKFTSEDVRRIREAHLFGARQVDLAAVYGVHQTAISTVTRRAGWRHVE